LQLIHCVSQDSQGVCNLTCLDGFKWCPMVFSLCSEYGNSCIDSNGLVPLWVAIFAPAKPALLPSKFPGGAWFAMARKLTSPVVACFSMHFVGFCPKYLACQMKQN
jgi:hypothetical protein